MAHVLVAHDHQVVHDLLVAPYHVVVVHNLDQMVDDQMVDPLVVDPSFPEVEVPSSLVVALACHVARVVL